MAKYAYILVELENFAQLNATLLVRNNYIAVLLSTNELLKAYTYAKAIAKGEALISQLATINYNRGKVTKDKVTLRKVYVGGAGIESSNLEVVIELQGINRGIQAIVQGIKLVSLPTFYTRYVY